MGSFSSLVANCKRPFSVLEKVPPYTRFAIHYNRVMRHVDYRAWAEHIHGLTQRYHPGARVVVDGGCGTGKLVHHLKNRGYKAFGFDGSMDMVRIAAKGRNQVFWVGNLTEPAVGRCDVFCCLYDSLLYLGLDEIRSLGERLNRILGEKGLFIFDAVPENHLRKYWANVFERHRGWGWELIRRSWYDREKQIQFTEIEIFYPFQNRSYLERHVQHIFSPFQLKDLFIENGLIFKGWFEDLTLKPWNGAPERVHVVFQRG